MGTSHINRIVYTTASAAEAFKVLYEEAREQYGNDGYSGTFATTYFIGAHNTQPDYVHDIYGEADELMNGLRKGEASAYPILGVNEKKRRTIKKKIVVKEGEDFLTIARNSVNLKPNERFRRFIVDSSQEVSAVTAAALKEKVITKYFIIGDGGNSLYDWSKGFDTQAAARARAVEYMKKQDTAKYPASFTHVEVVGLSRRESGAALVDIERIVKKTSYEITITIDTVIPDVRAGWLFVGLGSC